MIEDILIESLVKIANSPQVVKMCEPNIMQPFHLESWMVRRTVVALELLQQEWEKKTDEK